MKALTRKEIDRVVSRLGAEIPTLLPLTWTPPAPILKPSASDRIGSFSACYPVSGQALRKQ